MLRKSDFAYALELLKQGARVARHGWNGKGMWLALVTPERGDIAYYMTFPALNHQFSMKNCLPWIGMKTADDKFVPWTPSQTDLLAEDWYEVEE